MAATIHAGIAATIAAIVLPAVVADAFPAATPERAVPVLWVLIVANLVLALWHFTISGGHFRVVANAKLVWLIGPIFSLFVVAPLVDAAFSYWSQGQAMHVASIALFGCVIGGAFGAVLAFVSRRLQNHATGRV